MRALGVIDADGHVMESGAELAHYGWHGPSGNSGMDRMLALEAFAFGRATVPGARPFCVETRLEDMDLEGIGVSVNYPSALLLLNQLGPEVANSLARAYNSWAYETFTAPSGGRVLVMALVCIADPAAAVAEARRAVVELGAPGIVVPPFAGQVHLDDPSLDKLWALAEELDVAIGVHGGRSTTEPLLAPSSFRDARRYYAMAHPFGQMMAIGDLVIGGVIERFQRLRVAFLESGSDGSGSTRTGSTRPLSPLTATALAGGRWSAHRVPLSSVATATSAASPTNQGLRSWYGRWGKTSCCSRLITRTSTAPSQVRRDRSWSTSTTTSSYRRSLLTIPAGSTGT
jgi:predicted TIM-barrel fold metal-dependent hydrolase